MVEQFRWVVDANLLVSRLLAPGGVAAQAVDKALDTGVLRVSEATLAEVSVLSYRSKFDAYLSEARRRKFMALLAGVACMTPVHQHPYHGVSIVSPAAFLSGTQAQASQSSGFQAPATWFLLPERAKVRGGAGSVPGRVRRVRWQRPRPGVGIESRGGRDGVGRA